MSLLDTLIFGVRDLLVGGSSAPARSKLNLIAGDGVELSAVDDPTNARTNVTITCTAVGGGELTFYEDDPPAIGAVSDPGSAPLPPHGDHSHAHGNQAGGSTHALADGSLAGYLSPAHYAILAALVAGTYDATVDGLACTDLLVTDGISAGDNIITAGYVSCAGVSSSAGVTCTTLVASSTIQGTTITATTAVRTADLSAASGTLAVGASGISALVLGRAAASCAVDGTTLVCTFSTHIILKTPILYNDADEVRWRSAPSSPVTRRTDTVAAAMAYAHAADCTSITESWDQDPSAAGAAWWRRGQKGAAGQIGGVVGLASGKGGTPGTNRAGSIRMELGQQAGGTTDYFAIYEDSTQFLGFRRVGTYAYIDSAAGLNLTGTEVGFVASSLGVFRSVTAYFDQGTINLRTNGASQKCAITVANAFVYAYDAAVTSVTHSIGGTSVMQLVPNALEIVAQMSCAPNAVAYAASVTLNCNLGNHHIVAPLTGSPTIDFTNRRAGAVYSVTVTQGAGAYTITWGASIYSGAFSDQPSAGNGDTCVFLFLCTDGTNMFQLGEPHTP